MADDGFNPEGFPLPTQKKKGILRFAPSYTRKPRTYHEEFQYTVPHISSAPKREPIIWPARTKEQIDEDNYYIAARQAARHDSDDEEELVYRKTKTTPPKRAPYTAIYRPAKPAREEVVEEDVPPPKLRPSGPLYPKSSDEFWVMDKYGRTYVVKYAEIKNMDGRWVRHDVRKDSWYFMRE